MPFANEEAVKEFFRDDAEKAQRLHSLKLWLDNIARDSTDMASYIRTVMTGLLDVEWRKGLVFGTDK